MDKTNVSLQEELRALGEQLVALQAQLQREENKYERSLLQFNLQLVQKDDEIQGLTSQLVDAKENLAKGELDSFDDLSAIAHLREELSVIKEKLKVGAFRLILLIWYEK